LAYEYEFGGEAKTTVKGLSTPALSIKGSSGMLELGYIIQNKDVNVPAVYIGLLGSHGEIAGVCQQVQGGVNSRSLPFLN